MEDDDVDAAPRGRASSRSAGVAATSTPAGAAFLDPYEVPAPLIAAQKGSIAPSRPSLAALGGPDAASHSASVEMLRVHYVPSASMRAFVDDDTAPLLLAGDVAAGRQLAKLLEQKGAIPHRLRRALVLEQLMWVARMEHVDESRLQPLRATARPPLTPVGGPASSAWCNLPPADVPSVLQAWHFLSGAAVALGLDSMSDAVHDSAALSAPLPQPWLDLRSLTSALAWSGRACDDVQGRYQRTLTTLFASLTRYALTNLHSILGGSDSAAAPRTLIAAVRASVNSRLDGDTWPEFARQLLVAVAQQRTATAAWSKCGQFIEEDAAENVVVMDDEDEAAAVKRTAAARDDVSWVHTQRGAQVLAWFAPTAARELHQATSGIVVDAAYHGLGFGGATQSRTDVLWRPFDAYAFAQTSRAGDKNKRTFPAVGASHPIISSTASSGAPADADAANAAATLSAACMAQLPDPTVGKDLVAAATSLQQQWHTPIVSSTVTVTGGLAPAAVGRGACVAAPSDAESDEEEKDAKAKEEANGVNSDWRSLILSLRGVSTHDGSKHHAYIYGAVVECVRSLEVAVKAEKRARKAAAAAAGVADEASDEEEDEPEEDLDVGGDVDAMAASSMGGTPLKRLLATLRSLVGQRSPAEVAAADAQASAPVPARRGRASLTIRRPSDLERQRRRREKLDREPMVLTAGKIREATLFALRRYDRDMLAESAGDAPPSEVHFHGGMLGEWVWPGSAAYGPLPQHVAGHEDVAALVQQLDTLRRCEAVRRLTGRTPECEPYNFPLDADAAGVPDYYDVVGEPCDVRTIGQRLACAAEQARAALERIIAGVPVPTPASFTAQVPVSEMDVVAASASVTDVVWKPVMDRWRGYDSSAFVADFRRVFANAQRYNATDSVFCAAARTASDSFEALLLSMHINDASPVPAAAAAAASAADIWAQTAAMSGRGGLSRVLQGDARYDDMDTGAEIAAAFLKWPSKRSYGRNKYLRGLANRILGMYDKLKAAGGVDIPEPAAKPPEPAGSDNAAVASEGAAPAVPQDVPDAMDLDAAPPAPLEAAPCRVCGRLEDVHAEQPFASILLVCEGCEYEYHPQCITPALNSVPESVWHCPMCVASGVARAAAISLSSDAAAFAPGGARTLARGGSRSGRGGGRGGRGRGGVLRLTPDAAPALTRHTMDTVLPRATEEQRIAFIGAVKGSGAGLEAVHDMLAVRGVHVGSEPAPRPAADTDSEMSADDADAGEHATLPRLTRGGVVNQPTAAERTSLTAFPPALLDAYTTEFDVLVGDASVPLRSSCHRAADVLSRGGKRRGTANGRVAAGAASTTTMNAEGTGVISFDAPPGAGGSDVEHSVALGVAPLDALPLWRLAALLTRSDVSTWAPSHRVRLLQELINIVCDVPDITSHFDVMSDTLQRVHARIERIHDFRPGEMRSAALARMGTAMHLVQQVRQEELRRVHANVPLTWLTMRPPPAVRALSMWGPHPPPLRALDSVAATYIAQYMLLMRQPLIADGTLCSASLEALRAAYGRISYAVRCTLESVSSADRRKCETELRVRWRQHFGALSAFVSDAAITAGVLASYGLSCIGEADPAASALTLPAVGDAAEAARKRRRGADDAPPPEVSPPPAPAPRKPRVTSRVIPAPDGSGRTMELRMEAGPWPDMAHSAGKDLAALASTLPDPLPTSPGVLRAAAEPLAAVQHAQHYRPSAYRGVGATLNRAGRVSEYTCRIQIAGGTRIVGSFQRETESARAYDLVAWCLRGPSAYKSMNFVEDVDMYERTVQAFVRDLPEHLKDTVAYPQVAPSATDAPTGPGSARFAEDGLRGPAYDAATFARVAGMLQDAAQRDASFALWDVPAPTSADANPAALDDASAPVVAAATDHAQGLDAQHELGADTEMTVVAEATPVPAGLQADAAQPVADVDMADAEPVHATAASHVPLPNHRIDPVPLIGMAADMHRGAAQAGGGELATWLPSSHALFGTTAAAAQLAVSILGADRVDRALAEMRIGSTMPPQAAVDTTIVDASPAAAAADALTSSLQSVTLLVGHEADAGAVNSSADASLQQGEVGVLHGLDELRWQRRAVSAYTPPRFTRDELGMLVHGLVYMWARDAAGTVSEDGFVPPQVWVSILLLQPFASGRTACELREQYELLRGGEVAHGAPTHSSSIWRQLLVDATNDVAATLDRAGNKSKLRRGSPPVLPYRPYTPAERQSEACRMLEMSRAMWEWEDTLRTAEVTAAAVPGRLLPIGTDRTGTRYFVMGAYPAELWLQEPPTRLAGGQGKHASGKPQPPKEVAGAWSVASTPAQLDALIAWLHPLGVHEGPLRDALLRRRPLLVAAMQRAGTSNSAYDAAQAPLPVVVDSCLLCSAACAGTHAVHCFVCHTSFTTGSNPVVTRALFAQHAQQCWQQHAHDALVRAVAILCAHSARGDDVMESATRIASVHDVPLHVLTVAVSDDMRRAKHTLVRLMESVDWSRLRQRSNWSPMARAAWVQLVLAAPSPLHVTRCISTLETALRADDMVALLIRGADAPASALASPSAASSAAASASGSSGGMARPWQWLPRWYNEQAPSPMAAEAVHTVASVFLRIRTLAMALQEHMTIAL